MYYLVAGKKAPDFMLRDQNNADFQLSSFRGKWVVLYFYPKGLSPYCAREAQDFNLHVEEFKSLGAVVIGVSPDSVKDQTNFISKNGLKITLLSDVNREIAGIYEAQGIKTILGQQVNSVHRRTYLIDPNGNIDFVWKDVQVTGHAQAVLDRIKQKEFVSKEHRFM